VVPLSTPAPSPTPPRSSTQSEDGAIVAVIVVLAICVLAAGGVAVYAVSRQSDTQVAPACQTLPTTIHNTIIEVPVNTYSTTQPDVLRAHQQMEAMAASVHRAHRHVEAIQRVHTQLRVEECQPAPPGVPSDVMECGVCFDSLPASEVPVLVPCGHRRVCRDCVARMADKRCPTCRQPFTQAVSVFEEWQPCGMPASSAPSAPPQPPDEADLKTLMGMGFPREMAADALQRCGGDVNAAAEDLSV